MKRQISLQSIICIAKLSPNVNVRQLTGHKTETILKKMFQQRDCTSINKNIHIIPQKKQKYKKSSIYMPTKLTPQEFLHMKDLLPTRVIL